MTAVDASRIPRRRPGRPLPDAKAPATVEEPPLPVSRPSTSAGWAPPYTDTPDEIADRRAALLAEIHRADFGQTHHTAAEWDRVIRDGLAELHTETEPAADAA